MINRKRVKIAYLLACEPIPLDRQKLETLAAMEDVEVHLVYWARDGWALQIPFSEKEAAAKVHVLRRRQPEGAWPVRFISRVAVVTWFLRTLISIGPEVIHACSADVLAAAAIVRLLRWRARVIFDLQDTPDWMWRKTPRAALRVLLKSTSRVFVTSPRFYTQFLQRFSLLPPGCRALFIPNAPWRRQFAGFVPDTSSGDTTIGCIGGLREEGPIRCLIEAVDILRGEGLPVRLFYAGVGPYRSLLDDAAKNRQYLCSAGAFDYTADVASLYAGVHVIFACYRNAPDRRVHLACRFADAVNCGLPIVVGSGTYMGDLVQEREIGVVAIAEDTGSLVAALRPLVKSRTVWGKFARNAKAMRPELTFDSYITRLVGCYRELIETGTSRAL